MVCCVKTHLAWGDEPVIGLIKVLNAGVDGPAFIAGVENAHDAGHGHVNGYVRVQRFLEILPVLAVERCNRRDFVEFCIQDTRHAHGKRRMDVHNVNAAAEDLGLEDRIKYRCWKIIIIADYWQRMATYHLVGQFFVLFPAVTAGLRTEDNDITISGEPAGVIVHHLDDTVHHGVPGVYE